MKNKFSLMVAAFFILSACSHNVKPEAIAEVADLGRELNMASLMRLEQRWNATDAMQKSISSGGTALDNQDNYLSINKALLNQELLFMPAIVTDSTPIGLTNSFGAKIIYFNIIGNKIYMLESMQGETIADPYQPEKIIAEFPIISETSDSTTFDFKAGLDRLIILEQEAYTGENTDVPVPVTASYLRDFVRDGDTFAVYHVARISERGVPITATFSYTFKPAATRLTALAPDEEGRIGYFLTPPQYERITGEERRAAARIYTGEPFTFYISSNTPPEYYNAIRDGILAWNDVFGQEILRAERAPEGVTAGNPLYSIFQWVGLDDANFAYADFFAHPRSGEIVHANVVFPSSFAVFSQERARQLLRYLNGRRPSAPQQAIGLLGFETPVRCNMGRDNSFLRFIATAADGALTNDQILSISQRYTKLVVMHEIGHDLGLRHNFAGNLASEIAQETDESLLTNFVANPDVRGPLPSSSVMDYLIFTDRIRMHSPGQYDRDAIRWGYFGEEQTNIPPYCTDEDADGSDLDCARGDAGRDPARWRISWAQKTLDVLSYWLIDNYIDEIDLPEDEEEAEERYGDELKSNFLATINGLVNYLDEDLTVRDLDGRTQSQRRTSVAEAIANYLTPSDAQYDAILDLANTTLVGRLDNTDESKRTGVIEFLGNLRYDIIDRVLRALGARNIGPLNEANNPSELSFPSFTLWHEDGATGPIATALSKIVSNHISVEEASETFETRMLSANVLLDYNYATFEAAKNSAIAGLERNILDIQRLLPSVTDPSRTALLQRLLTEEQELHTVLTGGVVAY